MRLIINHRNKSKVDQLFYFSGNKWFCFCDPYQNFIHEVSKFRSFFLRKN